MFARLSLVIFMLFPTGLLSPSPVQAQSVRTKISPNEDYPSLLSRVSAMSAVSLADKGDFDSAKSRLEDILRINPNSTTAHGELARILATCPKLGLRDGKKAVEHAVRAVRGESEDWTYRATLAAAFAEAGDFGRAIDWQLDTILQCRAQGRSTAAPLYRLELYMQQKPYRQSVAVNALENTLDEQLDHLPAIRPVLIDPTAMENVAPKVIIQMAVAAHGGKELLTKLKAGKIKFKGTTKVVDQDWSITNQTTFQMPNRLRNDVTVSKATVVVRNIGIYDGKTAKLWMNDDQGKLEKVQIEGYLTSMRDQLHELEVTGLAAILDGGYDLSMVEEAMVNGKTATGIRVSKKGQRDFTLFFDAKTHLLVKTESRVSHSTNKEVMREKYFTAYRDVDGLKIAHHIVTHQDSEKVEDVEVAEYQRFETVDDAIFARP